MRVFQLLLILTVLHSEHAYDIRDVFHLNWRIHGGHTADEKSYHDKETSMKSATSSSPGNPISRTSESHHQPNHWIPPKLKLGVDLRLVGGKWPFAWTLKQHHPVTFNHGNHAHSAEKSSHNSADHQAEYFSAPVPISSHPDVPNVHQTNHRDPIKPEVPQLGSATSHTLLLKSEPSQPPHRLNGHAQRIIRNFGIHQNHQIIHSPPDMHDTPNSFGNSNVLDHHYHSTMNNYVHPGNMFPTSGNSLIQTHPHPSTYDDSRYMQTHPDISQSSSTNTLHVMKTFPTSSHPNNLKYSTIYSNAQPKVHNNIPSESKQLTSVALSSQTPASNSYSSHNTNCYDCQAPYKTRGSLTHALIDDIQNLPTTDDDKLIRALQIILAIAQEEAQQRNGLLEGKFMRKR